MKYCEEKLTKQMSFFSHNTFQISKSKGAKSLLYSELTQFV